MERKYYRLIVMIGTIMVVSLILLLNGHKLFAKENNEALKSTESVNNLINSNQDKELITNKLYGDGFVYLVFQKDGFQTNYLVDYKTGEEKNLEDFIREDKKSDFQNKINELLELKYPKFVVEAIKNSSGNRTYSLTDNELVIEFLNVDLEFAEETKLDLKINFNEIKDYLTFAIETSLEYENENGYAYDKNKKTIALTFDDGPNGSRTNEILNILEDNKAHATFFMVGNRMASGASTILNVLNHNCEIGSHSYNHTSMKRQKLEEVIADETKTEEIYKSITGRDLIYTRPPYGAVNNEIKAALTNYIINWNIDPEDWLYRDSERVVNHILEHAGDGDIILLHDSYDSTVEAVRELLPKLYLQGYQVVSVGELANLTGNNLELNTIYRSFKRN